MHGRPGTAIVVEGERHDVLHESSDPLLIDGATLGGLVPWEWRYQQPPSETVCVRGIDGTVHWIGSLEALKPHRSPITTGGKHSWRVREGRSLRVRITLRVD